MSLELITGPPGSGRTTRLLGEARDALAAQRLVWWVGLPMQRAHVLRRLTEDGRAVLGFEFMSAQQLYYRLLTAAGRLRPLVVGTARLVRVVEALRQVTGALPTPGEARLYAAAIAEAKRFGVTPADYRRLASDAEQRRFQQVYTAYQHGMLDVWDYDDARREALELVTSEGGAELFTRAEPRRAPHLLVVDGLRELGPLELRLFEALAGHVDVRLSLPEAPPGADAHTELPPRAGTRVERFVAANPVEEGRWVMSSLKRDLFGLGMDPLELAVVVPPDRAKALVVLAEEYGVPLMDETPRALADDGPGRTLVDLLELPDLPTPTRLLAVPALEGLARLALAAGVAGTDAVTELADRHGHGDVWRHWRDRLQVGLEPVEWARELLREALPGAPKETARQALAKAQEAAKLGSGDGFRAWWATLLQDARQPRTLEAGVALLGVNEVSGRRYRKAYLVGAVEGAYGAGEREDYFLPEERRADAGDLRARPGLPRRFQGRDAVVAAELLERADHLVITAPRGDQGGPSVRDEALFGAADPPDLPHVEAGSRLELDGQTPFEPDLSRVHLGRPFVERLRRYSECSFRLWGEAQLEAMGYAPAFPEDEAARLRSALIGRRGKLDEAGLAELTAGFPRYAAWLREHAATLLSLTYGVELGGREGFATAFLHATGKETLDSGRHRVTIYRFVLPDGDVDQVDADGALKDRWTEYWAVGALLEQKSFRVENVNVRVWPVGGEPAEVAPGGVKASWRRVTERRRLVRESLPGFSAGVVRPNPGYICRDCPVFDLCREGVR